jgi:hypothetical protein
MKTLPEILRDAFLLLDEGHEWVVIERGDHEPLDGRSSAWQLRLRYERDMGLTRCCCSTRGWLGEQWSSWQDRRGWLGGGSFDTSDVLATDWRIIA